MYLEPVKEIYKNGSQEPGREPVKKGDGISERMSATFLNWFLVVKIYWNTKCTTTGYSLLLFSSLPKKGEEDKNNELAKPALNKF